jgi:hypothetical protein
VQGNGELNNTETCPEMAAGDRNSMDGLGAQLIGQGLQIALVEKTDVGRFLYRFEHHNSQVHGKGKPRANEANKEGVSV